MKRFFSIALTALLMLTSCIDDVMPGSASCGYDGKANGNVYFTLSFSINPRPTPNSRTYGPREVDEQFERSIRDVRVFLVDKSNENAPVVEIENVWMSSEFTTVPIPVPEDKKHGYLIYVVANPPAGFSPNLSSFDAFIGEYSCGHTEEACSQLWKPNHFMMVNSNNHIEQYRNNLETPYGGIPLEIDETASNTRGNPFKISVCLERVAAKIVVDTRNATFDFTDVAEGSANGCFTDVRVDAVALINCANSFNLIQHWNEGSFWEDHWKGVVNNTVASGQRPYGYPYLWCDTPNSRHNYKGGYNPYTAYYELNSKAKLYNGLNEFMSIGSQAVNPDDFNNYAEQYELQTHASEKFKAIGADGTLSLYCLENNSPMYMDLMQNYDRSIDNFASLPSKNLGTSYPAPDLGGNISLSKLLSSTQMRALTTGVCIRVRAKVKSDSHGNDNFVSAPGEGSWKAPKRITATDYPTFYGWEGKVYTNLTVLEKLTGINFSANTTAYNRSIGLSVYENGYMYYIYWVKDHNYKMLVSNKAGGDVGETPLHAVLRNTLYKINVTDISRLGMDTPATDWYLNRSLSLPAQRRVTPPTFFLAMPILPRDDDFSSNSNPLFIGTSSLNAPSLLYYIHPSLCSWSRW